MLPVQVKDKRGRTLNTENIGAGKKTSIKDKIKALKKMTELIKMLKNL